MKKYQYKNSRGQDVGYVENNTYFTMRNMKHGEIFMKKRVFNGKEINNPIAIDLDILEDLYEKEVKNIEVTITGVEKLSFVKRIPVEIVMLKGENILFDKRNKQGQNVTGFGKQVVFSYDWGVETGQKRL
jgi:hypothetical protein|tara:strand:+ start:3151 stop:3540 length:390 start_codon:yes stop_codon:yes gene_type:complete